MGFFEGSKFFQIFFLKMALSRPFLNFFGWNLDMLWRDIDPKNWKKIFWKFKHFCVNVVFRMIFTFWVMVYPCPTRILKTRVPIERSWAKDSKNAQTSLGLPSETREIGLFPFWNRKNQKNGQNGQRECHRPKCSSQNFFRTYQNLGLGFEISKIGPEMAELWVKT